MTDIPLLPGMPQLEIIVDDMLGDIETGAVLLIVLAGIKNPFIEKSQYEYWLWLVISGGVYEDVACGACHDSDTSAIVYFCNYTGQRD